VPIVVCAQSTREADIVAVFEAGADDYLVTPIRPVELTARLRAVLRRTIDAPRRQEQSDALVAGDVEIRVKEHRAYRRDVLVDLSPIEFRLLTVLVQEVGRAVSHSRLIASVWGPEYVDCRHYLRLYIKYLRSKMEDDPKDPRLFVSEWGVGYRFEPAVVADAQARPRG
jgi:two-component system KDP operon response regulator KdpE